MRPARVHQELLAIRRNGQAEMIGHGLVPVKSAASRNAAARSTRICLSAALVVGFRLDAVTSAMGVSLRKRDANAGRGVWQMAGK